MVARFTICGAATDRVSSVSIIVALWYSKRYALFWKERERDRKINGVAMYGEVTFYTTREDGVGKFSGNC